MSHLNSESSFDLAVYSIPSMLEVCANDANSPVKKIVSLQIDSTEINFYSADGGEYFLVPCKDGNKSVTVYRDKEEAFTELDYYIAKATEWVKNQ